MKRLGFILLSIFLSAAVAMAQTDRREVRSGNRDFKKGEWAEADIHYRKALVQDSTSVTAAYNLSNNLYRQENYDEAAGRLDKLSADSLSYGGDVNFNRGDVAIAQKDWQKAVDSFRKAMLADPSDMEAKENYAYAKQMLQDQQQNGGGQDNQQQDQQDQQDNQDEQQQDKQDQGQDNQDGQQDKQQDGQQQPDQQISQQQAQQMLKALQAEDEKTQEKVRAEKAKAQKTRQKEKNW